MTSAFRLEKLRGAGFFLYNLAHRTPVCPTTISSLWRNERPPIWPFGSRGFEHDRGSRNISGQYGESPVQAIQNAVLRPIAMLGSAEDTGILPDVREGGLGSAEVRRLHAQERGRVAQARMLGVSVMGRNGRREITPGKSRSTALGHRGEGFLRQ
jgi:hypothetical protein